MKKFALKEKTCCFTGHRMIPKEKENEIVGRLDVYVKKLIAKGVKFFGVGGAEVQVDNTLDSDCKTENQAQKHGRHPQCITLDNFLFENLVHGLTLNIGLGVEVSGGSSLLYNGAVSGYSFGLILSSLLLSINGGGTKYTNCCQNYEKFFHDCFGLLYIIVLCLVVLFI